MKDIIIKSMIIAILASISGSIISDLLFAKRTEPYVFSKEEMAEYEQLTVKELTAKYGNPKIVSELAYVLSYPMCGWFWKEKLKVALFYFLCCFFVVFFLDIGSIDKFSSTSRWSC